MFVATNALRLQTWSPSGPQITPESLQECAVFVPTSAYQGRTLQDALEQVVPWLQLWREHPLWQSGTWVCQVDNGRDLGGRVTDVLPFHSDMSRYRHPPRFGAIRCVRPDPVSPTGGSNLLLHADDIRERLRQIGRYDILDTLMRPRSLNLVSGDHPQVTMLPDESRRGPLRIFDLKMATKGDHLEISDAERTLIAEFLTLCYTWDDLILETRLDPGEWIIFSNHTFLHSRTACGGLGRTVEVCLGNDAP